MSRWYNAVWRWHFYAGMLCVPLVLWLSITGTIYLWKPQIEALIDRPYAGIATGPLAPPSRIAQAAVGAVPGSHFAKYQLPAAPGDAVQVSVGDTRVYVNPSTLAILKTVGEQDRLMRLIFRLHGELMIGDPGSWIVETIACWAIVMILTGLYLWWPRKGSGLAGVIWPRLHLGKRAFWRDIHAVTGIWVSMLALFLILTGLPWANVWGGYFKEVRAVTGLSDGPQDWTTGTHEGHHGMTMGPTKVDLTEIDRVVPAAAGAHLAGPVLVAPPKAGGALWTAKSDSGDRPLRADLGIDGGTGQILTHKDFADRHWVDRAVGYGIAAHEGQLFGLANQLLSMVATMGLSLLAISGAILWWRRRPIGLLGAPIPLSRPTMRAPLLALITGLGILFPLFGLSLIAVLILEWVLFRRLPPVARWLGLRQRIAA
ncbi:PepSY-associated TM helix domain-containing protein [Sphingomonas montanisoli]|uniref:PepSY-associated TM helix domain-containing protein n=1 Tax=Sphingomonas montanisoli TaxID=2606412 RepID=UPI001FEA5DB8|nr:PepSY domain-containing protein [Sphingomonas montanisoli]